MRLIALGDIHLYRLWVPPWRLVGKAMVGQANLWLNRRKHFDRDLLRPVLHHVDSVGPDMLLCSGDLTTTALEKEFHDVGRALQEIVPDVAMVIVPGNHDRYTFKSLRKQRIEAAFPTAVPNPFPHLRQLMDRWWLLAMDSSVPRAWTSRGELGDGQLAEARRLIGTLPADAGLIVMTHYPFSSPPAFPRMNWHHELADADALQQLLHDCPGRVVFLHGHTHVPTHWRPDDMPHVSIINTGAPCLMSPDHPRGQGFWEIKLPEEPTDRLHLAHHVPLLPPPESPDNPLEAVEPGHMQWTTDEPGPTAFE